MPESCTEETLEKGIKYIKNIKAEGGTEILTALEEAFVELEGEEEGETEDEKEAEDSNNQTQIFNQVILITDGNVHKDEELSLFVKNNIKNCKLHIMAIGKDPDKIEMKKAANYNGGSFTSINQIKEIQDKLTAILIASKAISSTSNNALENRQ
jgi:hypothetical protein